MIEKRVFDVLTHENKRVDIFLSDEMIDYSRSSIKKIIKSGDVLINGKLVKPNHLLSFGDSIEINLTQKAEIEISPQNIPFNIVYEDNDLIVVNKVQGMVVHPGAGNYEGTLVNALLYHCGENLSKVNDDITRPGIVHRIDKDTSGLLLVAKNDETHLSLAKQLKEHTIKREYRFVCVGTVDDDKITVDNPIGRNPKDRLKMAVVKNGKNAITHFEVLKRYKKYTYMKAVLGTGRTHQIRVHASYIGHPLLGDKVYGYKKGRFKLNGQTLHAKTLGFIHPKTNKYMEFNSKLPEYFIDILEKVSI